MTGKDATGHSSPHELTFVLDVDGVMTTGQFLYDSNGKAYKVFGPHDADGLKMLRDKLTIRFISADKRGFPITKKRIEDMGYPIELVSDGTRMEYMQKNYDLNNVIFMGDGYYDAAIIKACKFGIAPISGRKEAKEAADYVTESKAAEGAVLDACLEIEKKFFGGIKT